MKKLKFALGILLCSSLAFAHAQGTATAKPETAKISTPPVRTSATTPTPPVTKPFPGNPGRAITSTRPVPLKKDSRVVYIPGKMLANSKTK